MNQYERILAAVTSIPWAIKPERGKVIADILTRRVNGERGDEEVIRLAMDAKKQKAGKRKGSVALIPVYGIMTQRADLFTEMSGMTSTETVGRSIDEAAADPDISAIVMDYDTPGGSVYGIAELGAKIQEAGKQKKVIGVANSEAASAGYWAIAQSSEVVVTPGGEVGSIGVYMMHTDVSRELETRGRTVTLLSAGERKTAGHPYGPLSDVHRAELQQGVDDYYDLFIRAVASGRGVSQKTVRDGFGQGGMVRAEQAVNDRMADKIDTLEGVLKRYGSSVVDFSPAASSQDWDIEIRRRRLNFH